MNQSNTRLCFDCHWQRHTPPRQGILCLRHPNFRARVIRGHEVCSVRASVKDFVCEGRACSAQAACCGIGCMQAMARLTRCLLVAACAGTYLFYISHLDNTASGLKHAVCPCLLCSQGLALETGPSFPAFPTCTVFRSDQITCKTQSTVLNKQDLT